MMQSEQDPATILDLLQHGNQLKRTVRTGWAQRGVPNPESVAAHSYGVAYLSLVLAQQLDEHVDLGRLLAMALLHDLPEGITSDIPGPAWRFLPEGSKAEAERQALQHILGQTSPFPDSWLTLWEELSAEISAEARLVHDADRLELYLQAANYEEQTGNRKLSEFWHTEPAFHFPISAVIYGAIRRRVGRE